MSKNSIHATKADYAKLYKEIEKLSIKLDMELDWNKIMRASYDNIVGLPDMMIRTFNKRGDY